MKERYLEPFTSLDRRYLPLPNDNRRPLILASYWLFAFIGAAAWYFIMNPLVAEMGDLSQFEALSSEFLAAPMKFHLRLYSNFPLKLDVEDSILSGKMEFVLSQPEEIKLSQGTAVSTMESELREILPKEPLRPFEFNLVLVQQTDSLVGESYYSGEGRTFIAFVPASGKFELRRVLERLEAVQFRTVMENIAAAPLFRTQKLRFIVLNGKSDPIQEAYERYFTPLQSSMADMFVFNVRFQEQLIAKLPEDFSLAPEFFSGIRPVGRFTSNDEIGPEQPFRFVLLSTETGENDSSSSNNNSNSNNMHIYIPNWGIVVQGGLDKSTMQLFVSALRKHLGLSDVPFGAFSSSNGITAVELDAFAFALDQAYVKETLKLLKLSKNASNEPITHELFNTHFPVIQEAFLSKPQLAFRHAYQLHYDQSRLDSPYFPDEHKFAVYLPVVLPLVLPLVVGLLKYVKERKEGRRLKASKQIKTE